MTKEQKFSLVCLCHTPPSASCRLSIQSRFQRISARKSGSFPPDSGILRSSLRTAPLNIAHAIHLLGGVTALFYVDVQALRLRLGPAKRTIIDVSAIFWHFLDGLWLYLMVLFYVWG